VTIGNTNVNPGRRTTTSPGSRPRYFERIGQAIAATTNTIPTRKRSVRIGGPLVAIGVIIFRCRYPRPGACFPLEPDP